MKALTIWQPYAQAIAAGLKKYETRSWATRYRGPLAIHASLKPLKAEHLCLAASYGLEKCPCGEIIVFAELTDCILMTKKLIEEQPPCEIDFGDWRPGRFAWRLDNIQIPNKRIKLSGRQGLWTLEDQNQLLK